jgi:hypothetical protein
MAIRALYRGPHRATCSERYRNPRESRISLLSLRSPKIDPDERTRPQSGAVVPLFNPRQHVWSEHFIWSVDGLLLLGLTSIGRATIAARALNRERVIAIQAADSAVGVTRSQGTRWSLCLIVLDSFTRGFVAPPRSSRAASWQSQQRPLRTCTFVYQAL